MNELLRRMRDVCLLRRGPQDLPYAPAMLATLVVLLLLVHGLIVQQFGRGAEAPARALLSVAVGLGLPWLALVLAGRGARWVQTGIALAATAILFALLALPVLLLIGDLPRTPEQVTPSQMLAAWLSLALLGWQLAVQGHILRHALELPFRAGVLLAVVFFALEFMLAMLLLGRGA